jgi:hypothetical protein
MTRDERRIARDLFLIAATILAIPLGLLGVVYWKIAKPHERPLGAEDNP